MSEQKNYKIAIVGAGRIGLAMYEFLTKKVIFEKTLLENSLVQSGDKETSYTVDIFDITAKDEPFVKVMVGFGSNLTSELDPYDIIINACPHFANQNLIDYAFNTGKIYLDFSEDVKSRNKIESLYYDTIVTDARFIPACGLAPGLVNIMARNMIDAVQKVMKEDGSIESLKLRVGALPQIAFNDLGYAITWSVDGLVNEYVKPCEVIEDNKKKLVRGCSGHEKLFLDEMGVFEAFATSGGVATLTDTYLGVVKNLNYKTIRQFGHLEKLQDGYENAFGMSDSEYLYDVFSKLPSTRSDRVIVALELIFKRNEGSPLESDGFMIEYLPSNEYKKTAIESSTCLGMLLWIDYILKNGKNGLPFISKQEDFILDEPTKFLVQVIFGKSLTRNK